MPSLALSLSPAFVEWVKIARMRNLIAHHYDKVLDEFVWESLRTRIPDLTEKLGLGND